MHVSSASERPFWRLLIRGAVLLLVTLGIYRFWLATDVRRFLWANTEIAGERLEYTGTARELLIGFLIAIAMLVPLNVGAVPRGASASAGSASSSGVLALRAAGLPRPVRDLSRAPLSADPHGLSRRALPSDRLGAALCGLRDVLVGADRCSRSASPIRSRRRSLERFKLRHTFYGDLQAVSRARACGCSCAAC